MPTKASIFIMLCAIAITQTAVATQLTPAAVDAAESQRLAKQVKREFLHAWRNYERYAWGHDELRPLSRTPRDCTARLCS
jgi:hypothetical protein